MSEQQTGLVQVRKTTFLMNSCHAEPLGMDWEYFEISPSREAHFIDYGDNEYELVILVSILYDQRLRVFFPYMCFLGDSTMGQCWQQVSLLAPP